MFVVFGAWPNLLPGGDQMFRWDFLTVGSAALSTSTFIFALTSSLLLVVITLFFGRIFCGWACPLGTLADFLDYIFHFKTKGQRLEVVKYHILLVSVIMAALGISIAWMLDPLTWSTRILGIFSLRYIDFNLFVIFSIAFIGFHFLYGRRAFCRILCPLGAGLGVIAKFSVFERVLDLNTCTHCNLCVINNRSFAIVDQPERYNSAECFQCRECETICPEDSISFKYGLRKKIASVSTNNSKATSSIIPVVNIEENHKEVDKTRRQFLSGSAIGLAQVSTYVPTGIGSVLVGVSLKENNAHADNMPDIVRPPGAVIEKDFINRCIRCNACFRACPTSTLVPSDFSRPVLAYGTPVLDPRAGGCLYECNDCGEACPTGAIQELEVEEKQKLKMGSAKINEATCIPYSSGTPCSSCVAVCPYDAISWVSKGEVLPWEDELLYPVVDASRCTGCGLCETACPVSGKAAINVSAEYPRKEIDLSYLSGSSNAGKYFKQ